ncbi:MULTISPECIES: Stp1/IreP family PP2C-type Ser/Thr phosphatase [unclassified Granulicatella]|uniref:Stp1/IreP family PP2C-type Ser/Thr phosphatase n=1 Tax=unclassified Granulicatella TaxID=2630493 RepID=UPI0010748EDB|nr:MULTISPECIES: Stp1/IreP family PP2C-type Ser/Thr phosphatase [unclassified Granulicatella]MBF0780653.1 Stp1/IreP family PP2C-type Ser/Thr phosphatase [Granulicatella sp. 19428wC4_WM01]TFU94554.1 Stp1/IreP family PP2C-type Ser/Thr phosphatase [Granulicatella sp. WM01]
MKVAHDSHVGMKRLNNEDYLGVEKNKENRALYVLCDGVGGNKAGEVASKMVVNYLKQKWQKTSFFSANDIRQWMLTTIEEVNKLVYERSKQFLDLKGMSTTLVCASTFDNQLIVSHVGDSRLYIYRTPELKQITKDHTLVRDLLDLGGLSEEEALNHPMKHVITRAVGSKDSLIIDITQVSLQSQDYILLCSDGLTDMLSDDDISSSFKEWKPIEERVKKWIEQANLAGGRDNISIILIHYKEKGEM